MPANGKSAQSLDSRKQTRATSVHETFFHEMKAAKTDKKILHTEHRCILNTDKVTANRGGQQYKSHGVLSIIQSVHILNSCVFLSKRLIKMKKNIILFVLLVGQILAAPSEPTAPEEAPSQDEEEVHGTANKALESADNALKIYNKTLDSVIPWET